MKKSKTKKNELFRKVGLWATIWWGVSCGYVLLLVWLAKDYYVNDIATTVFSMRGWRYAVGQVGQNHPYMLWLAVFIIVIWIIGAYYWLKALKLAKMSYKDGLKDLFLTIR